MKSKLILAAIALMMAMTTSAQKREMRGAWIQCVNGQFQNLGTKKMQQTLTYQLDELQPAATTSWPNPSEWKNSSRP